MADIDLTEDAIDSGDPTTATLPGGALLEYLIDDDQVVSGTGGYNTFLATNSSGNSGVSEGFNSDVNSHYLDIDFAKTESIAISSLKIVDGYYVTGALSARTPALPHRARSWRDRRRRRR